VRGVIDFVSDELVSLKQTMSVRHASDLTVVELKEELRKLGLSGAGSKNELIMRLNESTPTGV